MASEKPNSSHAHNVASILGGGVNHACVEKLEELLRQAKAGHVIGIACVTMRSDLTAAQTIAGKVGGSIMIGQFRIAEHELLNMTIAARDE